MSFSNSQNPQNIDRIQRIILLAYGRVGIPLSTIYALLAVTTFNGFATDLVAATSLILTGIVALSIAYGRLPNRYVHAIPLVLLLAFGGIAKHEYGFQSMAFTVLPAFALILRFIVGPWSAGAFAMGMTTWGALLMANPTWVDNHDTVNLDPFDHSRIVILVMSNLFVLWFAGVPASMLKKAYVDLSRSAADLEKEVNERTLELAQINRELEATNAGLDTFARSVSHDLRAPLRGILTYTMCVLEDDGKRLSEESKAYLGYSIQAANRSNELIDGFLELARSATKPLEIMNCDLAQMAANAMEALQRQNPTRVAHYIGPPSAKTCGDRSLLRSVIENLLSNAWKYTGKTPDARIEFAIEESPEGTIFAIRDNGAGFDMSHADRLFQNFSRLHTNEEFEGTGIGLSNVHRILQRHGGWIRGEGEPGKGAEFRFWLPARTDVSV